MTKTIFAVPVESVAVEEVDAVDVESVSVVVVLSAAAPKPL